MGGAAELPSLAGFHGEEPEITRPTRIFTVDNRKSGRRIAAIRFPISAGALRVPPPVRAG